VDFEIKVNSRRPVTRDVRRQDSAAMQFVDRNFRLACIDAIHCAGQLPGVFHQIDSQKFDDRISSLDAVVVTEKQLGLITDLAPDGGDEVYLFVDPEWGAENDDLYISGFDDIVMLPNLETLWIHAVTNEGALDLSLLLKCKSLREISADSFYLRRSNQNGEVVARLKARGVRVQID
jgi:hypothetical protein